MSLSLKRPLRGWLDRRSTNRVCLFNYAHMAETFYPVTCVNGQTFAVNLHYEDYWVLLTASMKDGVSLEAYIGAAGSVGLLG